MDDVWMVNNHHHRSRWRRWRRRWRRCWWYMIGSVLRTGLPSVLDKVSLTSPPRVGHRHQKSQQMQEQNAASPAYYMCSHPQSHKMTTNWEFLGISWDSLRLLEIPRNTMDLTLSQPTKDVSICKHVFLTWTLTYTRPVSFLTQTPVKPL